MHLPAARAAPAPYPTCARAARAPPPATPPQLDSLEVSRYWTDYELERRRLALLYALDYPWPYPLDVNATAMAHYVAQLKAYLQSVYDADVMGDGILQVGRHALRCGMAMPHGNVACHTCTWLAGCGRARVHTRTHARASWRLEQYVARTHTRTLPRPHARRSWRWTTRWAT